MTTVTERGMRVKETTGPCLHCGATDTTVVDEYVYTPGTNGRSTWQGPYCLNRVSCWARVDRQVQIAAGQGELL